jgi:hypothetical protein
MLVMLLLKLLTIIQLSEKIITGMYGTVRILFLLILGY